MLIDKQTWKIGAIYLYGSRKRLHRDRLIDLLIIRAGLSEPKARQLAQIWVTSRAFASR